jgi:hypothetical protein
MLKLQDNGCDESPSKKSSATVVDDDTRSIGSLLPELVKISMYNTTKAVY